MRKGIAAKSHGGKVNEQVSPFCWRSASPPPPPPIRDNFTVLLGRPDTRPRQWATRPDGINRGSSGGAHDDPVGLIVQRSDT